MVLKQNLALALGVLMASGTALANDLDGSYALDYYLMGHQMEICVALSDEGGIEEPGETREEGCRFVDIAYDLYGGEWTEDSISGVVDDAIGDLEDANGTDIPEEVEALIHAKFYDLWVRVEGRMNQRIDDLPHEFTFSEIPRKPGYVAVEFADALGNSRQGLGTVDYESGTYNLMGVYQGSIDYRDGHVGYGHAVIPVNQVVDEEGIYLSIFGSAYAAYNSHLKVEDPLPVEDEPPSDEPPAEEPPSDEPPSDEPPSDEPPPEEPGGDEPPPGDMDIDAEPERFVLY